MNKTKQRQMDKLVGKPFVLPPTNCEDHKVVGELKDGEKIRCAQAMTVFNDGLLYDALEGIGKFRSTLDNRYKEVLAIAELLYGIKLEVAVPIWLELPNLYKPYVWGTKL